MLLCRSSSPNGDDHAVEISGHDALQVGHDHLLAGTTGGAPATYPQHSFGLIIWLSVVVFPLSGGER